MSADYEIGLRILKTLAVVLVLCTNLAGCSVLGRVGRAGLPSQYVVAAIDGNRQLNAPVTVFRSAAGDRQTWPSSVLFLGSNAIDTVHDQASLGFTTAIYGRGGSSPGIGTGGTFYVLAFWGRESTTAIDSFVVSMFVSVSHDGIAWTVPISAHSSNSVHSNAFGVVPQAAISVAPAGANGAWFATYGDDSGAIKIVPLPVTPGGFIDRLINTSDVTTAFTSNQPPALSFLDNRLVLAFWDGSSIQTVQTTDGRVWPGTSTAALLPNGSTLTSAGGPPFLYRSGAALILSSTEFFPGATEGAIRLHSSTDGVTFTEVTTIGVGQGLLFGAAAAGPAPTEYVVLYPARLQPDRTRLFASGHPERTIMTETDRRVSVAGGP